VSWLTTEEREVSYFSCGLAHTTEEEEEEELILSQLHNTSNTKTTPLTQNHTFITNSIHQKLINTFLRHDHLQKWHQTHL
jgi:hypothetical protein